MQKKKEKKQEKKKYTKMVLTKHNKLKDITAGCYWGRFRLHKISFLTQLFY